MIINLTVEELEALRAAPTKGPDHATAAYIVASIKSFSVANPSPTELVKAIDFVSDWVDSVKRALVRAGSAARASAGEPTAANPPEQE